MQKITYFLWLCSGATISLLKKCPTEASKYAGIGATILFTGLFAALSAMYAFHSVFDDVYASMALGVLWGLLIFNIDRLIVSSIRKKGKVMQELSVALPRILLAILISIVIAKPLELKIFEKEIEPELVVMEQETYARQEKQLQSRFQPTSDSLKSAIAKLKKEIHEKEHQRNELVRIAQEEADGTGGSKQKNLGPIYKLKKADADAAEKERVELATGNLYQIYKLEKALHQNDSLMLAEASFLKRGAINGLAARIEALSRLTLVSSAIHWAHWFIIILFMVVEVAPVMVKLISPEGPYDNQLKGVEQISAVALVEETAKINFEAKKRTVDFKDEERLFVERKLDERLR